jgi:hypothetical protein
MRLIFDDVVSSVATRMYIFVQCSFSQSIRLDQSLESAILNLNPLYPQSLDPSLRIIRDGQALPFPNEYASAAVFTQLTITLDCLIPNLAEGFGSSFRAG